MKLTLIKKNGKCYVQLPEQFSSLGEVELFQLRGNFWLISTPLDSAAAPQGQKSAEKPQKGGEKTLEQGELAVLKKLMKIRFADRTPPKIEKAFSAEEKNSVRQLIKKGFVQVFFGKQYNKTGVYNIPDSIYPYIERAEAAREAPPKQGAVQQPQAPQMQQRVTPPPAYSELLKVGWLIIQNAKDAETFSTHLKESGLANNVKGVRGFDGKFYVATNRFLYSAYEKLRPLMEKKKEMHLTELAELANLEPEGVSVVLHLLAESGEVIEKKRDLFCLA